MAKINSRSKGNRAERVAAKLLEEWTGKKFARVPSSGGLQWKASHAKGDITCTSEGHFFPFCVEVKNYRQINFEHLLYLKSPKVMEFWSQCEKDASIAGKIPLLMMRYDGLPKDFWFLVMRTENTHQLLLNINKGLVMLEHGLTLFTSTDLVAHNYKEIRKTAKTICKLLRNGHK